MAVESGIEIAFCSTLNRHIVQNSSEWANPPDYYLAAPANFYAQFWHNHSVGALAYGFPYDDFDGYSSTVVSLDAQHMAFGIGWQRGWGSAQEIQANSATKPAFQFALMHSFRYSG